MKGRILIECDERGVHLDIHMHCTERHDRTFLVHALGKALDLDFEDYVVLATAEASGVLKDESPTKIHIDRDEFFKQLKEEQNES